MTPEQKHYDVRVTLRMPDRLKRLVHKRAIDACLTLNEYIVHVLLRWVETDGRRE